MTFSCLLYFGYRSPLPLHLPQLPHNLPTFKEFFQYFPFLLLYYRCSTILTSIQKSSSSWPRLSSLDSVGSPKWLQKMRNLNVRAIYKGEHGTFGTFVFLGQVILLGIAFYGCCCFYSPAYWFRNFLISVFNRWIKFHCIYVPHVHYLFISE